MQARAKVVSPARMADSEEQNPIIDNSRVFYVSVVDGSKWGLLLGPFDLHEEALRLVDTVRIKVINEIDGYAHFYAFGTASLPKEDVIQGSLNNHKTFHSLLYNPELED